MRGVALARSGRRRRSGQAWRAAIHGAAGCKGSLIPPATARHFVDESGPGFGLDRIVATGTLKPSSEAIRRDPED